MRCQRVVVAGLAALALQVWSVPGASAQGLPFRNGRPVVATVNADSISLDEFVREAGPSADVARLRQGIGTSADLELLDRLVTIKLLVQEANRMGLAESPDIQAQVRVTSREILREVLFEKLTRTVTPDPAVVDTLFKNAVREWKTASLLFKDKAAAEQARKQLTSGAAFDAVAKKAVASKAARSDNDNAFHGRSAYLPQIVQAIAPLKIGQVSPVVQIPAGFVVLRVVDMRYPQNAEALAAARKEARSQRQEVVLKAHEDALKRQYVTVHKAVLDSINYTSPKPGLDALLKDKRVIADIKGASPLSVGDLTDYLRMQFYHGAKDTKQNQRMNAMKGEAVDAMIGRRLYNAEAVREGIEKTNEYRDRVRGFQESLVFDSFIQRVIVPVNKMTEPEVRKYYDTHLKDYSSPEMMRIRGLAFTRRSAAEDAVRKMRQGADFGWLVANAEGQAPKNAPGLLTLDARPVTLTSMPDGLRKAVAGARTGEYRIYAAPDGLVYALAIQGVVAPTPRPYDEVREDIARKLYNEKLRKAVEAYAAKLRARSKVAEYLKRGR